MEKKIRAARKSAPKRAPRPAACREIFANLSEYLDGGLEPASCEEMQAHIASCPPCVAFIDDLRAVIGRCHSLDPQCDAAVASQLRSLLTREYLRLIGTAPRKKTATRV